MFVAYRLCSLYCYVLSKLKTLVKLVIQNLELNNAKTHHAHQMIQYANNLILILINIDET